MADRPSGRVLVAASRRERRKLPPAQYFLYYKALQIALTASGKNVVLYFRPHDSHSTRLPGALEG